jgi:hypothetical protein
VYGTGTGPDCRQIVQKLNEARGGLEQASSPPINSSSVEDPIEEENIEEIAPEQEETTSASKPHSKWDVYLDDNDNNNSLD